LGRFDRVCPCKLKLKNDLQADVDGYGYFLSTSKEIYAFALLHADMHIKKTWRSRLLLIDSKRIFS
jgi:hypothetical protein